MEPQQILIDPVQAWKNPFENLNHPKKCLEIGHIPGLVVLWEKRAVPETMLKNSFIRVGRPEPEIGQPQTLDRSHRVRKHCQRIEPQMLKNHRHLFVHISKALYQQLLLAIEVAVNRP